MLQNCELGSSDLKVRQQSLLLLCDVLHQHENLSTALNEGIATSLQGLLGDSDGVVRERSALALTIMARKPILWCGVDHSNLMNFVALQNTLLGGRNFFN